MWLIDEVIYPRLLRSILWIVLLQYIFLNSFLLISKAFSWHLFNGIAEWFLLIFHWKTILCIFILSVSITAFGALNIRLFAVEKHISSTRFEKICRSLSPHCLQYVIVTMFLGGIAAHCFDCIFHNFQGETPNILPYLSSSNAFEQSFIVGHGCFTGLMFSLKYFICNMYLVKFTLDQESKVKVVKHQMYELVKESFFCVLKAVHWYYFVFATLGSPLKILTFFYLGNQYGEYESLYSFFNPKLFLSTIVSGLLISFIWNLYLIIFNAFATEHHVFPINVPVKSDKSRTLPSALSSKDFGYVKYLAALDLRILAQFDKKRRDQIFAISHPGGHPHEWKAISGICLNLLHEFVNKLNEYSFAAAAASDPKIIPQNRNIHKANFEKMKVNGITPAPVKSFSEKVFCYFREKPTVSYFFDELPNTKLMKLFASSQPFIWIIDALGYLVSVSYSEDQYGVVQQTLPEIIRLLLDIKMAEEKMPVGLVGIRTYVKDPQGRYEHIHQRLLLKTTINSALCRIANTFKEDINGIYLSEDYQKYFQRYLSQSN